ncbi:hypothetical protein PVL29_006498 [Vitis rotundifolia]|uniref:F-box/LRR-repeat protein n=1 Tax=Vitis rotundifolia TaxID=103349 RepID=A0AA39A555_VITRO|nr:hypothetical protein PVL29_006498 [Vitis rotundifolia]
MEEQKLVELNMDCLVNVLGRVEMDSLLFAVPYVCKSWYKVSLDPVCWKRLVFPHFEQMVMKRFMEVYQSIGPFSVTSFINSIVRRSNRLATALVLPDYCTKEALEYAADECPALKVLELPNDLLKRESSIIPELISKWRNLEQLRLERPSNLEEILHQISCHCKNFFGLSVIDSEIWENEVSAIVSLPNIKYLILRGTFIERKSLVMILQGCNKLELLDIRDCIGFEGDDELLNLASHINSFKLGSSKLSIWHDEYYCSYDSDCGYDYY